MSGHANDHLPADRRRDPVVRILLGCLAVVAVIAAVALSGAVLIGWRLARDETPGRPRESFFVGDETRYWCLDLKPDDRGMQALFSRFNEINESTRRKVLRGTILESFPLPRRGARLSDLAPLTLEFALSADEDGAELPLPSGWSARGRFSRGLFKLRAGLKLMRFFVSRDPDKGTTIDVDGVAVTELHEGNKAFAFATVGDRIIATSGAERMRAVLSPSTESSPARLAELMALHDRIAFDGEDAWAFLAPTRVGAFSNPLTIDGATASFDVNDRDELAFSMIVLQPSPAAEAPAFRGSREDCAAVAGTFLPGVPAEAIEIDGDGARRDDAAGTMTFTGRISGVSMRLADLFGRVSELPTRGRRRTPAGTETPSATPSRPSPPPSADPRTESPAAPTHGETPTPGR